MAYFNVKLRTIPMFELENDWVKMTQYYENDFIKMRLLTIQY